MGFSFAGLEDQKGALAVSRGNGGRTVDSTSLDQLMGAMVLQGIQTVGA